MSARDEYSCGFFKWRPKFLQKFATMKYFMIVYGLLGTTQAMSFVYFISILTTLEKRFQIRSEVTGILMSGNEMSQIFLSIVLAYKGGKGNRPVWMAWGVLFSSLSCFILALPHFIYGAGSNALLLTEEFLDAENFNSTTLTKSEEANPLLCHQNRNFDDFGKCEKEKMESPLLSLSLIFFSQFVLGVGTTLYVTLGQPYLDDNSKKKNTPMLLGLTMALRSVGPAAGFVLGFLCLNLYVDPSLTPVIQRSDPRWIGAWWLGWIILGSVMTIFSFLIASFPRQLKPIPKPSTQRLNNCIYDSVPTNESKKVSEKIKSNEFEMDFKGDATDEVGILGDFKNAIKRVFTNKLLIVNILTAVFYILGASGYINFYTKYSETQFHQSAAASSMIAGVSTVISIVVGFLVSGFVISKFKPKETYLLTFNIFIAVIYMAGQFSFIFISCEDTTSHTNFNDGKNLNSISSCSANCSCEHIGYFPYCFEKNNQTFFSACHAGCKEVQNAVKRTYSNCSCLPEETDTIRPGPCQVDCSMNFLYFVIVQCLIQLVGCSGRITNVLITYRCVEQKDKPLAQGLCLFIISLLAFIPGPIIYGKVIDSTCLIWDNECGNKGNCWVYDKDAFRIYLNSTAICLTFGAFIFDIAVLYLGRNIKLYEETIDKEKT